MLSYESLQLEVSQRIKAFYTKETYLLTGYYERRYIKQNYYYYYCL